MSSKHRAATQNPTPPRAPRRLSPFWRSVAHRVTHGQAWPSDATEAQAAAFDRYVLTTATVYGGLLATAAAIMAASALL
ncbi:hypothetical protein GXB85_13570 [Cellulomonas sp. APG4]|uniref:hypothetical protein n=1 Tax=Cellulomonas sp. APG4 TaxID=1538656 RepID=UPI0013795559|nr:hypothetical protein [Cellulomonas sp. APG4]NCT91971.1 hypothetical protein [Cellulomonas sp. APG4]